MVLVSLLFGTLFSEDLTCIAAGLLIRRGEVGVVPAVLACALGIFVGDVGLWATGRVCGHAALEWPCIARQLRHGRFDRLLHWLTGYAAAAIIGSRFLPGTRLPLYLIAGFVRLPASAFVLWALIGTALWTPPLVLLSAGLDGAFHSSLPLGPGLGWLSPAVPTAAVLLILRATRCLSRTRATNAGSNVDPAGGA